MEAGGKRLRPILMGETYRMFGGTSAIIEPFQAAMEMIHTSSLIHDDLPAIDNDLYRRGKKTTHAVYGEALGILSGDALLNYAYETASTAFFLEPANPAIGKAMALLTRKTGMYGMLGGQSVDVTNEGKPMGRQMLDYIYENKDELEEYEIKSAKNIIYKKSTVMEHEEIKQFLLKKGYKLENINKAIE